MLEYLFQQHIYEPVICFKHFSIPLLILITSLYGYKNKIPATFQQTFSAVFPATFVNLIKLQNQTPSWFQYLKDPPNVEKINTHIVIFFLNSPPFRDPLDLIALKCELR